jgi:predicted deacylase
LTEVRAPVAGLLSGVRRQPLLCEGDLMARIQTRENLSETVDTYLLGHGQ